MTTNASPPIDFSPLQKTLSGEVHTDALHRAMLATDGSIFSVRPAGVVYPRHTEDVRRTVRFAARHNLTLVFWVFLVNRIFSGLAEAAASKGRGEVTDR